MTLPVGVVWKNESGARSTHASMRLLRRVPERSAAANQPKLRATDSTITAAQTAVVSRARDCLAGCPSTNLPTRTHADHLWSGRFQAEDGIPNVCGCCGNQIVKLEQRAKAQHQASVAHLAQACHTRSATYALVALRLYGCSSAPATTPTESTRSAPQLTPAPLPLHTCSAVSAPHMSRTVSILRPIFAVHIS